MPGPRYLGSGPRYLNKAVPIYQVSGSEDRTQDTVYRQQYRSCRNSSYLAKSGPPTTLLHARLRKWMRHRNSLWLGGRSATRRESAAGAGRSQGAQSTGPTRVAITPTQSSVLKVRLRPAYVTSQVDHYRVSSVCPRMMYFRRRMVRHSYMSVCGLRLFVPSDGLVVVYLLTDRPGSGTGPRQSPIGLLQTSRTTPKSTVGMQGPSPIAADRPGSGTGPRQTPTCNPPSTCSSCLLAMSLAAPASCALPPSRL